MDHSIPDMWDKHMYFEGVIPMDRDYNGASWWGWWTVNSQDVERARHSMDWVIGYMMYDVLLHNCAIYFPLASRRCRYTMAPILCYLTNFLLTRFNWFTYPSFNMPDNNVNAPIVLQFFWLDQFHNHQVFIIINVTILPLNQYITVGHTSIWE